MQSLMGNYLDHTNEAVQCHPVGMDFTTRGTLHFEGVVEGGVGVVEGSEVLDSGHAMLVVMLRDTLNNHGALWVIAVNSNQGIRF